MDLQTQADNIALEAINLTFGFGLRPRPDEKKIFDNCISDLEQLIQRELTPAQLVAYAAAVTYRANVFKHQARKLSERLIANADAIEVLQNASIGNADDANDVLVSLHEINSRTVMRAVGYARILERKVNASAASKKGKQKSEQIKDYAIELFKSGTWKNPSQARFKLWPQVKAKSVELGKPLTDSQGPITLYKWLLKYQKSTLSAG